MLAPIGGHAARLTDGPADGWAFIVKPTDFDGFAHVIQQIASCFLSLVTLPP